MSSWIRSLHNIGQLNAGDSTPVIERAIKNLREAGYLERVGPAKGGCWKSIE